LVYHGSTPCASNIDVVVLDAIGVTFVEGDDVSNLLIPFVTREYGCTNREADSATVSPGES
jgi:hypothetical protein